MFEHHKRLKSLLSDFLLAIFSGLFLIFSFPKFNQGYLAWIALIPLLLLSFQRVPLKAFWLGMVTGLVANSGLFYWVINAMVVFGGLPLIAGIAIFGLLVAFLSLYVGTFSFFVSYLTRDSSYMKWLLPPVLWTSLELARAHFMTGFPWANLGYSQFLYLPVIQVAEFAGVYGVSFLIIFVNATLAGLIHEMQQIEEKRILRAFTSSKTLIMLLVLAGNLAFGMIRMGQIDKQLRTSTPTVKVALIQGNIPQEKKWDNAYKDEIFENYLEMTREALLNKPDVVIWPESATPFLFIRDQHYSRKLLDFVSQERFFLLFGGDYLKVERENYRVFNSAFLLSPEGKVLGRYDKNHLVPFGEYVPLKNLLFFVNKMVVGDLDYSAGKELNVLRIPKGLFGVQICYEVIFPELSRILAQKGAQFIAVVTNDAWFGPSSAPYQHFSMVVFRAIETRLPFVRAANTGISGSIDQMGRILSASSIFTKGVYSDEIQLLDRDATFYSRFGDVFALAIALTTLLFFGLRFIPLLTKRP